MITSFDIRQRIRRSIELWLDKRQSPQSEIRLSQRLLFVFPTAYGCWIVLLALLLYLFGTNYQNNLILICAYLLVSLFCFCILAAFFNLYGLVMKAGPALSGYAQQPLQLSLSLSQQHNCKMIEFSSQQFFTQDYPLLPQVLNLELHPNERGYYQLGRFKLQSNYPFGLIRCWSYIRLQQHYWVYPKPATLSSLPVNSVTRDFDTADQLVPYQQGNALNSIDWKRLAQNPWQPVVRHYSTSDLPVSTVDLIVSKEGLALETELSEFCALLLRAEQQGQSYSLKTRTQHFGPDKGQQHLQRCLQALALC